MDTSILAAQQRDRARECVGQEKYPAGSGNEIVRSKNSCYDLSMMAKTVGSNFF